MTRILVVDDHPLFRKGLVALLTANGMEVVAEAASATEAVDAARVHDPDVVMMDLGLPDSSGVTATAQISAELPATKVVVITMFSDEETIRQALQAGAAAYVLKDAPPDQVVAAVRAVGMGARWLGAGVVLPQTPADQSVRLPGLTPRERAVAELLAKGLSNEVIALRLGLTRKTVANYVAAILIKVGAENRGEAIKIVRSAIGI